MAPLPKVTDAQYRALEAFERGEVIYARDMGWFQSGGWRTPRGVRADVAQRVVNMKLATRRWSGSGDTHADGELTDLGRQVLEARRGEGSDA